VKLRLSGTVTRNNGDVPENGVEGNTVSKTYEVKWGWRI